MIQWHEWNEETLAEAKSANKPIFLKVSYFACYWCHVMEEKTYSDSQLAKILSEKFIAISVDKDERPDIDEVYLHARQLITKQSGWPNHVFLTPDGHPFLACGVMLKEQGRDLVSLCHDVANRWQQAQVPLRQAAAQITEIIHEEFSSEYSTSDGTPDKQVVPKFRAYLDSIYDEPNGGFYGEPKFPHENYILFLLADYRHRQNAESLQMARNSLKKMAAGAMNDAIGGGFHRYCTDKEWRAPHFEKMVYSQALLARCYTELYDADHKEYFRDIAQQTLDFVLRELTAPTGAFYAALDAESNGIEGALYVWQEKELFELLDSHERDLLSKCYGLADLPEHVGHPPVQGKALYARQHLLALAHEKNRSYENLRNSLLPIFTKLKYYRDKREFPQVDTKVIASWNGLMIDSLVRASITFNRPDYLAAAEKAALYLHATLIEDALLMRLKHSTIHGFLEDYAYFESALLSLFEATKQKHWFDKAVNLHQTTDKLFWDNDKGGYFISDGLAPLFVRVHKAYDNGLPSANGVMLQNILRLWEMSEDEKWLGRARVIMAVYEKAMKDLPADFSSMIQAMLYLFKRVPEIK